MVVARYRKHKRLSLHEKIMNGDEERERIYEGVNKGADELRDVSLIMLGIYENKKHPKRLYDW